VSGAPFLLTPGPLTTAVETRQAMLLDWGSWDRDFIDLTASVLRDLRRIACAGDTHVCVPLQGSGTFAVEAALGTLVPRGGKVLVPSNGAYCQRIVRILGCIGREAVALPFAESEPVDPAAVEEALAVDPQIGHVALVHCETGTGILNPMAEVASVVAANGRRLIVDAMSSFGAIPIDAATMPFDALVSASGKCLEGVPGVGFVVARRDALEACEGNSRSLAMDLHDQWVYLEKTGQWRFTPPTHVVAALRRALDLHASEGGQPARLRRYTANCAELIGGVRSLGLRTFLDDAVQAPIIVTCHAPRDPAYRFADFYAAVKRRGFVIYPGKLTAVDTFRVGCIGAIDRTVMRAAVDAIADAFVQMGVRDLSPAN
jgi:2-aminoethylphosphonate-pyruvate transaminase